MRVHALESRIDSVRVFRSGAVVRRVATLPSFDGDVAKVRLVDLPVVLDDATVRLEASGPATLYDAGVALDCAERTSADGSREEQDLERIDARIGATRQRASATSDALAALQRLAVLARPAGAEGAPPREIDVAARLSLIDFKKRSIAKLSAERDDLAVELARLEHERRELAEHLDETRASRLPKPDELKKSVVATLRRSSDAGDGQGAPVAIALEYFVRAARWAPSYVLRVDAKNKRAMFELRALVCQSSSEDWSGVAMSLSTAEVMRHHELAELTSLRIGRAQPPPKKRTWKPLDADPAALFADYSRGLPPASGAASDPDYLHDELPPPSGRADDILTATTVVPSADGGGFGGEQAKTPPPLALPPPQAAPAGFYAAQAISANVAPPASLGMGAPKAKGFLSMPRSRAAPMPRREPAARLDADRSRAKAETETRGFAAEVSLATELEIDERLLSYGDLRMPPPQEKRGKLRLATPEQLYLEMSTTLKAEVAAQIRHVIQLSLEPTHAAARAALPARHIAPQPVDGFDFVHEGSARVDVPSDGTFHSLPLRTLEAPLVLRHVVVPRESPEVFRFVEIDSPIDAPMLAGPCDVYFDRDFLMTVDLATVAPRGKIRAGLGVDQAVKAARNTTFSEATTGLMGGSLSLRHTVKIELVNHRPDVADVEVRERIPHVPEHEEDIKLEVASVEPPWREWEPPPGEPVVKGAHVWRVKLEPKAKTQLSIVYVVKLPSKLELVGGNRRD